MSTSTTSILVRIASKTGEARGICSLELVPVAAGVPLPHFSAGAHIDVHLPNGITRQYSLCNPTEVNDRYQICVLRDPDSRGGSAAVHEQLAVGDLLEISEPKNHFPLVHEAPHSLLVAGGIGITPLIGMAEQLHHAGARFQLHYCAKSPSSAALRERIATSRYAAQVAFHFSERDGRVDLMDVLRGAPPDTHVYVCGPQGFMDSVLNAARALGLPEAQLHREYFATAQTLVGNAAFEVKLARSGRVVPVQANDSVLTALNNAGLEVPYSCEQGVCGTCLTVVLEGTPDHRDAYLSDEERALNDQFLPCCSRSKSPLLVLDL